MGFLHYLLACKSRQLFLPANIGSMFPSSYSADGRIVSPIEMIFFIILQLVLAGIHSAPHPNMKTRRSSTETLKELGHNSIIQNHSSLYFCNLSTSVLFFWYDAKNIVMVYIPNHRAMIDIPNHSMMVSLTSIPFRRRIVAAVSSPPVSEAPRTRLPGESLARRACKEMTVNGPVRSVLVYG